MTLDKNKLKELCQKVGYGLLERFQFVEQFDVTRPVNTQPHPVICRILGHSLSVCAQSTTRNTRGDKFWATFCTRCWKGGYVNNDRRRVS